MWSTFPLRLERGEGQGEVSNFPLALFKMLRWEERDKGLVIKDAELVS